MDPLTTTLLTAISAAAGAIAGGVGEAAGGDAWLAAQRKLAGWTRLEERRRQAAFEQALQAALTELRRIGDRPVQIEAALSLLTDSRPEGRAFVQAALEELLFNGSPDLGRLLDEYRRNLRFDALLRRETLPPWPMIQPVLQTLFQFLLPSAMLQHPELRDLVLDQAELQALHEARRTAAHTADSAATLRRIEVLLHELTALPRIHATITAASGATVSNAPLTVVLGNQTTYTVPAAPADLAALFESYRAFLTKTYATLDFRGIAQVQNVVRLQLAEVYVPLRGLLERQASRGQWTLPLTFQGVVLGSHGFPESEHRLKLNKALQHRFDENISFDYITIGDVASGDIQELIPLHTLVRDTPFLVILGDPGAGKSTLVKVIMLALAEGRAGAELGLSDEWLPIFFPVAAFAEARSDPGRRDLAPLDYLRAYFAGRNQPDYTPLFERALLAGRALLLFDGLDEVREDRLAIVKCLEDFIRAWDGPGNRFLATSRIAGYDDAPLDPGLFPQATIAPFDDDQIRAFTTNWSRAFERAGLPSDSDADNLLEQRATERAADLNQAIFGSPHITALARNPLLLTILAIIHNQGARLPDRRVDLYRLCVEALAETWNRARSLSGREIDVFLGDEKLDERFVVNLLGPVALRIHAENPGGIVETDDLERWLADTLVETDGLPKGRAARLAREFINLVNRETGLLQERGHRRYSFLHLTFEEYLAARGLLESATLADPDAEIHQRAVDPGWREVIHLAVASATQREASRLLLHLLTTPTDDQHHGRPAVLAAECLLDIGRNGATQKAWRAVIGALVQTLRAGVAPLAIRVEAGHLLGRLGDPRLLDLATGESVGLDEYDHIETYWCDIAAGAFWFGDERVENNEDASNNDDDTLAEDDEDELKRPPHFDPAKLQQAELPYSFKIARYPVTNADFATFLEANGSNGYNPDHAWWTDEGRKYIFGKDKPRFTEPRLWNDQRFNSPDQPVVGVSWYEAAAYCRWLTAEGHRRGWLPDDQEIRLPTSLEWERAARHTDQRPYPWGSTDPTPEHANYAASKIGAPSPVGSFPAGRAVCGAEDLVGNVFEWLATHNNDDGRVNAFTPRKDFTPNDGVLLSYTYYGDRLDQMCCGARNWNNPNNRDLGRSFRVVQSLRARL